MSSAPRPQTSPSGLISPDSGPIQLAAATDIGIVGIYSVIAGANRLPYRHGAAMWRAVAVEPAEGRGERGGGIGFVLSGGDGETAGQEPEERLFHGGGTYGRRGLSTNEFREGPYERASTCNPKSVAVHRATGLGCPQ